MTLLLWTLTLAGAFWLGNQSRVVWDASSPDDQKAMRDAFWAEIPPLLGVEDTQPTPMVVIDDDGPTCQHCGHSIFRHDAWDRCTVLKCFVYSGLSSCPGVVRT